MGSSITRVNAFVGVRGLSAGFDFGGAAVDVRAYNNIWFGNRVNTIDPGGGEHDYNWFFDNVRTEGCDPECILDTDAAAAEPNAELGSGDPFVAWQSGDFRLQAATAHGMTLPAPFDVDPMGAQRGADGVWDRAPHEYATR